MKAKLSRFLAWMVMFMTIAAFAAPANAATTYTPTGGTTSIIQNLVVADDANIPNITFDYTIQRGQAVPATATTIEILASEVAATIESASYSNAAPGRIILGSPEDTAPSAPTAGKKYAQKDVTVRFPDGSFTKPGVYRYVIQQTPGVKPGVSYDATPRYLDVFVVANNENVLSVHSCELHSAATDIGPDGKYISDPGVKGGGYTNTITQYNFDFSKTIDGNQGDKNKRFTFTLRISNAIPGDYPIQSTDVTGTHSAITVASDGSASATYDLTNGSSLKVLNLNQGAECTVSEDAQDYIATHAVDGGASVSGSSANPITLADASHSVAFTNKRDGIIPTGVIVTVAPFAIGLLVFGTGLVYMVARKLRLEED